MSGAQGRHRAVAALALLVALAAALVWAAPRPADLPTSSAALGSWLAGASVEDVVATLAGLAAELCLAWLCLGAVLAALGHLPGLVGRVAGSVAGRVAPAVVRRLVEAALGVTVAGASLAGTAVPALAASAGVIRPPAATLGGPATGTVDPATTLGAAWAGATARAGAPGALDTDSGAPALTLAAGTDSVGPAARLPSLDRPIGPPPVLDRPLGTPSSSDGPSAGSDPVLGPVRTTTDGAAVVRRGDSLWSIAARHLPAGATDHEIAAAWPRWYAANRTVIGPDPDLLRPGQRLVPPVQQPETTARPAQADWPRPPAPPHALSPEVAMTLTDSTPRPLTHLSVRRVPARPLEPPFDDEVGASPAEKIEGALALAFPLASGVPAVPEPPLRLVPGLSGPSGTGEGSKLPPSRPWAARLVQAVVEVLGGDRPAAQLARWTVAGVYYDLQRMATRAARERAVLATRSVADAVRSLHVSEPSYGVAEVCALVERAGQPRALALRLENRDGRWQCTVLRLV